MINYFDYAETIHGGDCFEILQTIPDNSIPLQVTSPPYNLGKVYEKRQSIEKYASEMKPIIDEMCRVCTHSGSICFQIGNFVEDGAIIPLDYVFYDLFWKNNMKLRNRIIWRYAHGPHCSKRFSGRYEILLFLTKSDRYKFNLDQVRVPSKYPGKRHFKGPKKGQPSGNPLGSNPGDYWEIVRRDWQEEIWEIPSVKSAHCEKTIHPCQFPVELVERCVLALSDEGDFVLDPFGGVGSTVIAALMHGRHGIMIEKDVEYVDIARQRIDAWKSGTLNVRPLGKPILIPSGKLASIPEEWET